MWIWPISIFTLGKGFVFIYWWIRKSSLIARVHFITSSKRNVSLLIEHLLFWNEVLSLVASLQNTINILVIRLNIDATSKWCYILCTVMDIFSVLLLSHIIRFPSISNIATWRSDASCFILFFFYKNKISLSVKSLNKSLIINHNENCAADATNTLTNTSTYTHCIKQAPYNE